MSESAAARVYAAALFEVARAGEKIEPIGEELEEFLRVLGEQPELDAFLRSPRIPARAKIEALEQIIEQAASETRNFLKLLVHKGRINSFAAVCSHYRVLAGQEAGRVEAVALSARALTPEETERITRAVQAKTGGQVVLRTAVNAALLGGVVIRVGDQVLDGSVRTRLAGVARRLAAAPPSPDLWEGDVDQEIDEVRERIG